MVAEKIRVNVSSKASPEAASRKTAAISPNGARVREPGASAMCRSFQRRKNGGHCRVKGGIAQPGSCRRGAAKASAAKFTGTEMGGTWECPAVSASHPAGLEVDSRKPCRSAGGLRARLPCLRVLSSSVARLSTGAACRRTTGPKSRRGSRRLRAQRHRSAAFSAPPHHPAPHSGGYSII